MVGSRKEKNNKIVKELEKEELDKKRRETRKKIIKWLLIFFLTLFGIVLYMHYVATSGLKVKEYKVVSSKLPEGFHGLKIVHFSDLHYLSTIDKKDLKNIVNKINELKPDIIVFTGDLLDSRKEIDDNTISDVSNYLNKLEAKIGIYAIKGNDDYSLAYNQIIEKTKIKLLNNSYELIYYKDDIPILLNGINSSIKDDYDIESAFSYSELDNIYTITLIHEPDLTSEILVNNSPDLILAGHSHNGQVRLPFISGLMKKNGAKKYIDSKYEIGDTTLFISGGLGTSKNDYRLFNRPSINLYRLVSK